MTVMISGPDIISPTEMTSAVPTDYQPLDLGASLNAGTALLGADVCPALGRSDLRGIPFLIGPDAKRCYIAVGPDASVPVRVAVGAVARRLIFAHRLYDVRPADGTAVDGEPGAPVARYRIRYADGAEHSVPIREHFEVANIPTRRKLWLGVDDGGVLLAPRHEGRWLDVLARQEEVHLSGSRDYYLWDWVNPRPDTTIESLTLEPLGRKYLLAAVTLGLADEEPFARDAARAVRIRLGDTAAAARDIGDLVVAVDRGAATYPYPLPEQLSSTLAPPGWGEPALRAASPAYVKIQAIPSATVSVRDGSGELARVRWGELLTRGRVASEGADFELIHRGRNWVRIAVLDDATGSPVPCRIHIQSAEGIPYPPHGHHEHVDGYLKRLVGWDVGGDVRLGRITYAYIDGTCEGWLPRGDVVIDVARGFEYEPLRERVTITPDRREVTLRLARWTDMNARGWYSGDTHVHFQSIQQAHFEARGEDLDVVNLMAVQLAHKFTNNEDFTGAPSGDPDGESIVYVSSENRSRDHILVLGGRRQILPWSTGGPIVGELGGTLDETPCGWADAAHAVGGTVVLAHMSTYAQHESLALVVTGRADAVEFYMQGPAGHAEYYGLLNCGYRLPLVGGTDKMTNEVPVGLYRTYARIDGPFTFDAWTAAIRAGRTFMTSGPLLALRVQSKEVGETVRVAAGGSVKVEASMDSIFPMNSLQIVLGGRVVAEIEDPKGARHLTLGATVGIAKDTWIAARCGGHGYQTNALAHHVERPPLGEKPIDFTKGLFAHTSPVYVTTGERWDAFDESVARYLLTAMEGGLAHIRARAPIDAGKVTYRHGEADHLAYLERPYREAAEMIRTRMRDHGVSN